MSVPEQSKKRDYSHYDRMSTAELEQILRLDFQTSDGQASDPDAIFYIAGLLAKRNGPFEPDAAWERFQTQYRPCADGRSLYDWDGSGGAPVAEQTPPVSVRPRHGRQLAVLAVVLAALLLGGMAAWPSGADIPGQFAQWADETFRFVSADAGAASSSSTDEKALRRLRSQLRELGMEDRFPISYLEGFHPGKLNVSTLNDRVSADVTFSGAYRSYTVWIDHFIQPTDNTGTFEKDDTPVEAYEHNDQTFYILSNEDTLTATTYNGEFMVTAAGALTREELKTVLNAIPSPNFAQYRVQIQADLAQVGQSLYFPQIPEGFFPYNCSYFVIPPNFDADWSESYIRGEEYLTFGLTIYHGSPWAHYSKDDGPVEEYVYQGITHYIFGNEGTATAVWMVENTEYYMWVTDATVDIKQLLRSIYASE